MMRTASGRASRARRRNSTPVICGMRWSLTMTWTGCWRSTSRAAAPPSAVYTSNSRRNNSCSEKRISDSSSTNRIGCLLDAVIVVPSGLVVGSAPRRPQGQAHAEGAAAPDGAVDFDGAAVIADDAEADRQPQPRPLTHRAGGEERLEEVRPVLRGNAAAVVLDLDHDLLPRAGAGAHRHDAPAVAGLARVAE